MKKSFFVGFLASLVLADGYQSSLSTTSTLSVQPTKYPSANTASLGGSSTTSQSVASNTNAALNNAKNVKGSTINQSIDSLFLRLPSSNELDRLILAADSVALLKTIQTVATDDSLTCDQRIAYLLEVLGRIRAAVEKKQFAADQLKVIIDGAKAEITRLEGEIARLNGDINNLWLPELQKNLATAVAKLQALYNQFNSVEANIAPNEAKVAGYQKEIAILTSGNDAERNRVANDRLKLTEVESLIRELEAQLADTRSREAALRSSIQKSQDAIDRNNARVADIRATIQSLEDEIKALRNESDRLRAKFNDLEIEVERLRTDIAVAQSKADRYRAQIKDLQNRIDAQKKNLANNDLDSLNEMIATLKGFIPTVQAEIDRHFYYCYGQGQVQVEQTGGVVVYIVKGERFGDYLRNQYGAGTVTPSLRTLGTLELRRADIFGPVWAARYGYPFPQSSLGGNDLNISGSFSCLNPGSAQNGQGTITSVGADYIGVKTSKGAVKLSLGSCSRVESTSELPTIGQNIAYKAVPSGAQGYNLYQASCW